MTQSKTETALPLSKRCVATQERKYEPRFYTENGIKYSITATVRYDDSCRNGHNSFAITADIRDRNGVVVSCGCQHDAVSKHFPELSSFICWHLVSTNGPLHYIANTVYWAKLGNLEYARSSAVWPDATIEQLQNEAVLHERLPELMADFKRAVESLGFVY